MRYVAKYIAQYRASKLFLISTRNSASAYGSNNCQRSSQLDLALCIKLSWAAPTLMYDMSLARSLLNSGDLTMSNPYIRKAGGALQSPRYFILASSITSHRAPTEALPGSNIKGPAPNLSPTARCARAGN